ncbi:BTB/POZ domain-containing protein KCTD17 [Aphelenchoides avenae]|nr:BTB/POZ domain-containing protein KCTD17 [Aphelenchus avenae]
MAADQVPDRWVRLNVGGRIFVTTKQTLSRSPFLARLFEADDRMPDAMIGSFPPHFIDRDPDRFTKVLNYLRDGTLIADKTCNLEELRVEADFYGLDDLGKLVDEAKAEGKLRSSAKVVTVKLTPYFDGHTRVAVVINPRDDDHFLLRHL